MKHFLTYKFFRPHLMFINFYRQNECCKLEERKNLQLNKWNLVLKCNWYFNWHKLQRRRIICYLFLDFSFILFACTISNFKSIYNLTIDAIPHFHFFLTPTQPILCSGLCCRLQRAHHRMRPRKLCAYFRDPFMCIDIMPSEDEVFACI